MNLFPLVVVAVLRKAGSSLYLVCILLTFVLAKACSAIYPLLLANYFKCVSSLSRLFKQFIHYLIHPLNC